MYMAFRKALDWGSRCRTEEAWDLWSQLSVSDLREVGSDTWGCWMSLIHLLCAKPGGNIATNNRKDGGDYGTYGP